MIEGNQDIGGGAEDAEDETGESRPQRAGEAGTTRFGMEDGDNTDTPATGQGLLEDDADEGDQGLGGGSTKKGG